MGREKWKWRTAESLDFKSRCQKNDWGRPKGSELWRESGGQSEMPTAALLEMSFFYYKQVWGMAMVVVAAWEGVQIPRGRKERRRGAMGHPHMEAEVSKDATEIIMERQTVRQVLNRSMKEGKWSKRTSLGQWRAGMTQPAGISFFFKSSNCKEKDKNGKCSGK